MFMIALPIITTLLLGFYFLNDYKKRNKKTDEEGYSIGIALIILILSITCIWMSYYFSNKESTKLKSDIGDLKSQNNEIRDILRELIAKDQKKSKFNTTEPFSIEIHNP